jgi:hypothetical protein
LFLSKDVFLLLRRDGIGSLKVEICLVKLSF